MSLESILCEVDIDSLTLILQLSVREGSARNEWGQRQKLIPLELTLSADKNGVLINVF